MKLFITLLVWTVATATTVASASKRNSLDTDQEQDRIHPRGPLQRQAPKDFPRITREGAGDISPQMSGRHLASTKKLVYSTRAAEVSVFLPNPECLSRNRMDLGASTYATKTIQDGNLSSTSTDTSVTFSFDSYTNCASSTPTIHTFTSFAIYSQDKKAAVVVEKNLDSSSYSTSTNSSSAVELCERVCEPDGEGDVSCYYGDCTVIEKKFVLVTVAARWTGSLNVITNSSSTCKTRTLSYNQNTETTDLKRSASLVAVSLTIDGVAVSIPAQSSTFGFLSRRCNTDISTYL